MLCGKPLVGGQCDREAGHSGAHSDSRPDEERVHEGATHRYFERLRGPATIDKHGADFGDDWT